MQSSWLEPLDDAVDLEYQRMLIPSLPGVHQDPVGSNSCPDPFFSHASSSDCGEVISQGLYRTPSSRIQASVDFADPHSTDSCLLDIQHPMVTSSQGHSRVDYSGTEEGGGAGSSSQSCHPAMCHAISIDVQAKPKKPRRTPSSPKRPWTPEEEERFLAAMDRFYKPKEDEGGVGLGQGVAEVIAFIVGTRTAAQVRSHAQKYFLRKRRDRKQGTTGAS
ncbi:hypothetical protein GUITHDRAFT_154579 [Guillardia theta CCMP2712]|uniref:HTH myb-type domain-containing protein n=1 Tax=Guillardia theta (strain CCMP2712) TaxID=905079 RepID=L1IRJ4_GUITC|nr:hypothetical protein GUITHDRAFT_154579 [Guillardia theta CCMP2712]EKX38886.1 hypothetical protein GUITHDRAFT_154579 [Guillardia theta CCMP2712]|eukprot:XP_005825866.1 hypothetical protein GUITHDRAFT_154579 [Guillardia theta CCMP2712]